MLNRRTSYLSCVFSSNSLDEWGSLLLYNCCFWPFSPMVRIFHECFLSAPGPIRYGQYISDRRPNRLPAFTNGTHFALMVCTSLTLFFFSTKQPNPSLPSFLGFSRFKVQAPLWFLPRVTDSTLSYVPQHFFLLSSTLLKTRRLRACLFARRLLPAQQH